MRETVDIIEDLVSGLTFTSEIKTVTDNGNNNYTLGVCCTYQIQPYCYVPINGTDYLVNPDGTRTSAAGDYYGCTSSNENQICAVTFDATDWYVTSEVGTCAEE